MGIHARGYGLNGLLVAAALSLFAGCNSGGGGAPGPERDPADSAPSAWAQPGGDPRNSRVSAYSGPTSIGSRGSYVSGDRAAAHAPIVFSMDSAAYFSTGVLNVVDAELNELWTWIPESAMLGSELALDSAGRVRACVHDEDAHPDLIPGSSSFLVLLSPEGELLRETEVGWMSGVLFGDGGIVYARTTDAFGESHDLSAWSAEGEFLWENEVGTLTRTLPEMALASIEGVEWIFAGLETRVRADGSATAFIGDSANSGLALDPQGNAYLESDGNVTFRKISPAGEMLWEYPPIINTDPGYSPAAVSAAGLVALQVFHNDRRATLLDSDGSLLWDHELPDVETSGSSPDVVMDAAGNCYFTLGTAVLAYSAAGDQLWTENIEGDVFVGQPAIAPNGNLYVLTRLGKLLVYSADSAAFSPVPAG